MKTRCHSLVSLVLVTLLFSFTASAYGQSVVDAARKERDRQKGAKSKVTVIGNGTRSATSTDAPSTPSNAVKPVVPTDDQGRDEKYWRGAFQQARGDLKRAEEKAAVLDLRLKELNTEMLRQSDVYNREYRLGPEIVSTQKQLEEARKAADLAKKKLADLEEDLRRSGGLPGWAR
jgi:hypothetical protein